MKASNRDIIEQLQVLRALEPNRTWAVSTRARLLAEIEREEATAAYQPLVPVRFFGMFALPTFSLSRSIVAAAMVAAVGVLAFVAFPGQRTSLQQAALNDAKNADEPETALEPAQEEAPVAPGVKEDVDRPVPTNTTGQPSRGALSQGEEGDSEPAAAQQEEAAIMDDRTFASLGGENTTQARFQGEVLTRINRVTVLSQEQGAVYSLRLAHEAKALYLKEDYDGALRVVMAAEQELGPQ